MGIVYVRNVADPVSPTRDVIVNGYAAIFGVPSSTLYEGLPEILAPGCFNKWLATGRRPYLALSHIETDGGLMAHSRSVRVWADDTGLAFRAAEIRPTPISVQAVQMIHSGSLSACSWKCGVFGLDDRKIERVSDGREMWVIRHVESVIEVGPCRNPVYDCTACWLDGANLEQFHPRLERLAREWQKSAPR